MTSTSPPRDAQYLAFGLRDTEGFKPPRVPAAMIARPALMERFERRHRITVVQALPGSGKTAAVASWAQGLVQQGHTVVWIRPFVDLDGPGLEARLREAFAARLPASADVSSSTPDEMSSFLRLHGGPVVLVIDDVHRVPPDVLLDVTLALLGGAPNLDVVLSGRHCHGLIEAVVDRSLDFQALSGRHLALTREELAQFAAGWGHGIDGDRLDAVHALTDGWLVPARLVLDDSAPTYSDISLDPIRRFFDETIEPALGGEPCFDAVARLAFADEVTDAVAAAVLACGDGRVGISLAPSDLIRSLERYGLLERVSTRSGPDRWRLSIPVREAMRRVLEGRDPALARECHRAVAQSLFDMGDRNRLSAVLRHARLGMDWSLLAQAWSVGGLELWVDFPSEAVEAFADLPADAMQRFPSLSLASMVARVFDRPVHDLPVGAITLALHGGKAALLDLTSLPSADEVVVAGVAGMAVLRLRGAWAEGQTFASRVESELAERRDRDDTAHLRRRTWFTLEKGVTDLLAGNVPAAVRVTAIAYERALHAGASFVASRAAAHLALVHAAAGSREQAINWLDRHAAVKVHPPELRRLVGFSTRIAWALLDQDRLDPAARQAVDDLSHPSQHADLWVLAALVTLRRGLLFEQPRTVLAQLDQIEWLQTKALDQVGLASRLLLRVRADLLLATGELNRAERLLEDGRGFRSWMWVPQARLELLAGNHARARQVASSGLWERETVLRDRIDLFAIAAVAALEMGDVAEATRMFASAHDMARRNVNVSFRAAMPRAAHDELMLCIGAELSTSEASALSDVRPTYPVSARLVSLSPREQAVLMELGRHDSIAAVAEALTVSVNTVKKQLVSVYAKLGVHDSPSALIRAAELGLLELG
jgi:LuxR family maltose regulon positive regulatory protein